MSELASAARERAQTDSPTHTMLRDLADEIERLEAILIEARQVGHADGERDNWERLCAVLDVLYGVDRPERTRESSETE